MALYLSVYLPVRLSVARLLNMVTPTAPYYSSLVPKVLMKFQWSLTEHQITWDKKKIANFNK